MKPLTLPNHQLLEPSDGHPAITSNELHAQPSLFAEYLGMALCVHAVFCAAIRLLTQGVSEIGEA